MANIKIKNELGASQEYNDITAIKLKDTNNNDVIFSEGAAPSGNIDITSNGNYDVASKATATVNVATNWGSIGGTLANQTDLQTALDGKQVAGSYATLVDGKVPAAQLPEMAYIPTAEKGAANGVATLGAEGKVPSTQLPEMDYIPTSEKGANNGVATLGSDGKVLTSQLPSFVDDVLEYDSLSAFPATGEAGKIYVAKDTNKTYRWSGSTYVEISASLALGETAGTAYEGNKGAANAANITALQTGKQDVISDLSTIRSGAAAGATAVQPGSLAAVATSGNYNDLSNKPSIPSYSAGQGITISNNSISSDHISLLIPIVTSSDFFNGEVLNEVYKKVYLTNPINLLGYKTAKISLCAARVRTASDLSTNTTALQLVVETEAGNSTACTPAIGKITNSFDDNAAFAGIDAYHAACDADVCISSAQYGYLNGSASSAMPGVYTGADYVSAGKGYLSNWLNKDYTITNIKLMTAKNKVKASRIWAQIDLFKY